MKVTIKTETSYGKPASPATAKQEQFAADIVGRINAALAEVVAKGFPEYAAKAADKFNALTNHVEAGPKDVITYLKDVTRYSVFNECYMMARRDKNTEAVKALDPRAQ